MQPPPGPCLFGPQPWSVLLQQQKQQQVGSQLLRQVRSPKASSTFQRPAELRPGDLRFRAMSSGKEES